MECTFDDGSGTIPYHTTQTIPMLSQWVEFVPTVPTRFDESNKTRVVDDVSESCTHTVRLRQPSIRVSKHE